MKALILGLIVVLSGSAFAGGNELGNGGHVLICKTGQTCSPLQTVFYDTYEALNRYNMFPVFPSVEAWKKETNKTCALSTEYALGFAREILWRMRPVDNELATELNEYVRFFIDESRFMNGIELVATQDNGIGFVPYNMELKQLVVQHTPAVSDDRRYLVNADYWCKMTATDQAAAILHEVIYRAALVRNPTIKSSERVRYFNGVILSGRVNQMTAAEYEKIKDLIF